VASNNFNAHENDLYQERLNIINWFEKNHVDDFDLYGYRWELKEFKNRYLNKFNLIFKIFKNNLKVYKGIANNKKNLLPNYKFTFCLENSKNYQGYITEKIFHCFFYNTVPVYFGAKNIDKFIPKECYINYDYFDNMNELNKYLKSIDKIQYFNFLKAADEFLTSPKSNIFSIDYYKKVVIKEILYFRQLINK